MTLWHKRLIFFLGKILAGVIVIVIIAIVLYYNFYFKKDNLIKYVPQRAVVYVNFRLDKKLLEIPLSQRILAELAVQINSEDLAVLNPLVSNNASLAIVPSESANSERLDYLLLFSLKETDGRLNPYLETINQAGWKHLVINNRVLNRNILLLSNSPKLIEEVLQVSRQEKPSLADKVEVIFGLSKFKIGYVGKTYIDLSSLFKILAENKDPRLSILESWLKDQKFNDLYLGLKIEDSSLALETKEVIKSENKQSLLMSKVPSDFDLSFSFYDLTSNLDQGLKRLAQAEPLLYLQIQNNREYLENLAGFNIDQDILPLLSGQTQIVLTQDQKLILAIKTNEIIDLAGKLNKIEQIAKQYFAIKNPVLIAKKLPDNSYINQITKQPNKIEFTEKVIAGIKVRQVQENGEEFAYYIKDDIVFLSNSSQKITQLLEDKGLIDLDLNQNKYNLTNFNQNLVIRANLLKQFAPILANISWLTILENSSENDIRLILE